MTATNNEIATPDLLNIIRNTIVFDSSLHKKGVDMKFCANNIGTFGWYYCGAVGSCEKITHWVSSAVKFWFVGSIGGKSTVSSRLWKSSPQGEGLEKSERRMLYQNLYQNKLKCSYLQEGELACFLIRWTLEIYCIFKTTVHSIV